MPKLYVYVDESGLDVGAPAFIVTAVVAIDDRHDLSAICEQIERETGKHPKWKKSTLESGLAFIVRVIDECIEQMMIYHESHVAPTDFVVATVNTIARAITLHNQHINIVANAVVFFDGLPRSKQDEVATALRKNGIIVDRVRGVDDEKEPLIRVADAICGAQRDALNGNAAAKAIIKSGARRGMLIDLRET